MDEGFEYSREIIEKERNFLYLFLALSIVMGSGLASFYFNEAKITDNVVLWWVFICTLLFLVYPFAAIFSLIDTNLSDLHSSTKYVVHSKKLIKNSFVGYVLALFLGMIVYNSTKINSWNSWFPNLIFSIFILIMGLFIVFYILTLSRPDEKLPKIFPFFR